MTNKIVLVGLSMLLSVPALAQDIYQMESFSKEDLNGTARYVGMGGAMSSLGANLSVMSVNPAGIGLYRSSDLAASFGFMTQEDADKFDGKSKTHMSFDQLGFVYAINMGGNTCRFVNLGFNYHKSKDFNSLINASFVSPAYASQTWQMADLAYYWGGPAKATPLTNMGSETMLIGDKANSDGGYDCYGASSSSYHKAQWGGIQSYEFNISTNLSEQFYLGLTVGASNVDFNSYSLYGEGLVGDQNAGVGNYTLTNNRDISGFGYNVKFGFIARPVAESPFRIGIAVSSPTYYDLKSRTYARVVAKYNGETTPYDYYTDTNFDYNIHTPWRFNFSLGHVIAKCLAIGAEYEYADYSTAKVTYGDDWDDYDGYWHSDETEDHELNNQADRHLKGVSTFKLGAELMVDPMVAIRCGYNYVSSPFKDKAYLNQTINSASLDYATSTDYMNVTGINRYTVGIGFNFGKVYADAACQYQHQRGHFYPFNTQAGVDTNVNEAPSQTINLSKTQLLFTVGYRF